ncbi:phosphoesterase PA-phosphatase [Halobacteriales archaeon QS_4_62_28]|nr:MAG: phosphoesterase PA-phosphatase [Halobacteriales archaeon QS_4_62_28]
MALFDIAVQILVVIAVANCVATLVFVGPDRIRAGRRYLRDNVVATWPSLVALVLFLVANSIIRDAGVDLSWLIGLNITGYIYAIEGQFVDFLQSMATPPVTAYFSAIYIYGYIFLLTFPVIAYALHDDSRPLRIVVLTYILNYGIGLVCYVVFIAYGPRNLLPAVESILYTNWPQSQLLTSTINSNTNAFPSLHASLSASVVLIAYRFRAVYPRWTPIATFLAISVAVSTMYLGIHWATDVLFGVPLGVFAAVGAVRIATPERQGWFWRLRSRFSETGYRRNH